MGLTPEQTARETAGTVVAANWAIVSGWNESKRYELTDAYTAGLMLNAVRDPNSGVLE